MTGDCLVVIAEHWQLARCPGFDSRRLLAFRFPLCILPYSRNFHGRKLFANWSKMNVEILLRVAR